MRKMASAMIILFAVFSAVSAEEPAYNNNSFARLSYVTGDTYIQRAADLAYEEGVVNMPIAEGDRLGTTEGRAEIYLGNSNYLRLDNNTKIDFLGLPKNKTDLIQIRVWAGNIYFSVQNLPREKSIEIHTSDISVYLLDQGIYRIDVRENTETEVFVFHGIVEAAGETESVLIKDSQRLETIQGHYTSRPTSFASNNLDSFDRWSQNRDSLLRKNLAERYLPEELGDFEPELAESGNWQYYPPYGHVWIPVGVAPGWRPYYNGRWLWYPICGWTWLPYEPWGWATFHYGRWQWSISVGWYWIPRTVWGPGWISWYEGYDYWGWTPLSYYDRPGVVINNIYYSNFTDAYYPHDSRALTMVPKNMLRTRNISKAALSPSSIQKLKRVNLTKKTPKAVASTNRVSVKKLGDKKVFLRTSPETVRKIKTLSERQISKTRTGYASSPSISSKNLKRSSGDEKKTSTIGRIYDYITGSDSKSSKSRISNRSSPNKSTGRTSSSGSKVKSSTSGSSSKKSTVKKPSSRTRSSSSKTKKKKK